MYKRCTCVYAFYTLCTCERVAYKRCTCVRVASVLAGLAGVEGQPGVQVPQLHIVLVPLQAVPPAVLRALHQIALHTKRARLRHRAAQVSSGQAGDTSRGQLTAQETMRLV